MNRFIYPPPWAYFWRDIPKENCSTCAYSEISYTAIEFPFGEVNKNDKNASKYLSCQLTEKDNRVVASEGRTKRKFRQCYYKPKREIMDLINNKLKKEN